MSVLVYLDECKDSEALPLTHRETFYGDYLVLLRAACHDVGPAAQTLGALLIHAKGRNGLTFASQATIAATACLPLRTVHRQLKTLAAHGWIENQKRQLLPGGRHFRRTCTIKLTSRSTVKQNHFPLPKWLAKLRKSDSNPHGLTWAEMLIIAYLGSQQRVKDWIENGDGESIGCADGRESMGNSEIIEHTGINRNTFWAARKRLLDCGIASHGDHWDDDEDPTKLRLNPEVGITAVAVPPPPQRSREKPEQNTARPHLEISGREQNTAVKSGVAVGLKVAQEQPNCGVAVGPIVAYDQPKSGVPPLSEPSVTTSDTTSCENLLSQQGSRASSTSPDVDRGFMYVDEQEDQALVQTLCTDCGITGECAFVWVLACWHRSSAVSMHTIIQAVTGWRMNGTTNPVGYLFSHVRDAIGEAKFNSLKKATKIPRGKKLAAPKPAPYIPQAIALAEHLSTPREPTQEELREHNRQAIQKLRAMKAKSG